MGSRGGWVGVWLAGCALAIAGCSDDGSAAEAGGETGTTTVATAGSTTTVGTTGPGTGGGTDTSGDTGTGGEPPMVGELCEDGLPFSYVRDPEGTAIDAAQRTAVTMRYLELLQHMQYFDFLEQRIHGWPQSDPQARYWFGTWWSGVTIVKSGGQYTFRHEMSGADNNGLRTGPLLEGVCQAHALWDDPQLELLVRQMMRGFMAWMRAMERMADDPDGPMLSRAFYPESISTQQAGTTVQIDYSLNRPGVDADPSQYVHVPTNPHYGDIWVKNKRSKDDIGHMLRAIAQLSGCRDNLGPEAQAELDELRQVYSDWSQKVEADGWRIATLDQSGEVWFPPDTLANFIDIQNAECDAMLSIRLAGHGDPGDLECGNGIGPLDPVIIGATDHNGEILRSFHEAAINYALMTRNDQIAQSLMDGLAIRIVEGLDGFEGQGPAVQFLEPPDLASMMIEGAAAGVPLTAREVAWLHARIDEAATSYQDPVLDTTYAVFDPATPDGEYFYGPFGLGLKFRDLATLLATCASPCLNPTSEPVLDCDLVRSF